MGKYETRIDKGRFGPWEIASPSNKNKIQASNHPCVFHPGSCGSPSDALHTITGTSGRSAVADRRSNLDDVRGPLLHPTRLGRG